LCYTTFLVSKGNAMVEFRGKVYGCHLEVTLDLIGGKWKSLILWHLAQKEVMRFGALTKIHPLLTQKMLTQQLRELETDGLIVRHVYAQVPPKVEYSLTPQGQGLRPVLDTMVHWGQEYVESQESVVS